MQRRHASGKRAAAAFRPGEGIGAGAPYWGEMTRFGRRTLAVLAALPVALLIAGLALTSGNPDLRPERVPSPLFDPAATPMLEDRERDGWQQPARVVAALGLRPGETVADVGSGSGYLLPYLSAAVGPRGRVLAEEIQASFLPALRQRAARLGNVEVVLGTARDPGLPPGRVDCFVLLTVYHEVEDPPALFRALRRAARPGARLAILDFDGARHGIPPAPRGHQISAAVVEREAAGSGWRLAARHEFLSSQFFLVFQ